MTRRLRSVVLVVLLAATAAACGSDSKTVAPAEVDPKLAPPALDTNLKLYENRDKRTIHAFANAGKRSLVGDGRIWEIRRADRLIGTLQISTVLPEVDLTKDDLRDSMVRQILPGSLSSIRVGDVEVFTSEVNGKAVYVWFGKRLFEVLQLRDRATKDFEPLATQVIDHQATIPSWEPLPDLVGASND
ncbi:MAG: hypothetical protein V7636_531 [Actinomycetota bacterium]